MKVCGRVSCFVWVLLGLACTESVDEIGRVEQAVGPPRPDLVVTSVTGPVSVNGPFVGAAEVCNRGTANSLPTTVNIYLSRDKRIDGVTTTGLDPYAGTFNVIGLFPGQCRTLEGPLNVTVPADAKYVIAGIVDEANAQLEVNDRNNTIIGDFVWAGVRAELFIASLRAPRLSRFSGEPLPIEVRVCNQGTIAARASTLGLYRSTDATITTAAPDITLATLNTPALQVGECVDLSGTYAWGGPGPTAYVGAIVDPRKREPELNESNNTAVAQVDELDPISWESAVVESLSASAPGESFWRQARWCTVATESLPSTVQVLGSTDAVLVSPWVDGLSPDVIFEWFDLDPPPPLVCRDIPISFGWGGSTSTPEPLAYYGLASSSLWTGVAAPVAPLPGLEWLGTGPGRSNFSVGVVEARASNGGLQVQFEVCAEHFVVSASVQFYVSDDRRLDLGVAWADRDGGLIQANLDSGCRSFTHFIPGPIPDPVYVLARVDPNGSVDELLETDNDGWSAVVRATPTPNLVVRSAAFPIQANSPAEVRVEVCNHGAVVSPASSVGVYLEHDRTIPGYGLVAPGSVSVGQVEVPALAPDQCVEPRANLALPSGAGGWRWRAIVDANGTVAETREDDNSWVGPWIGLGSGPDLVVNAIRAAGPLPSAFTAYLVQVCNIGDQPSAAATVTTFGTVDRVLEPRGRGLGPTELPLGAAAVPTLAPSACVEVIAFPDSGVLGASGNAPIWTAAWVNDLGLVPERTTRNNGQIGPRWSPYSTSSFRVQILRAPRALDEVDGSIEVEVCNDADNSFETSLSVQAVTHPQQSRWEALNLLPFGADPFFSLPGGTCERRTLALEVQFGVPGPLQLRVELWTNDPDRTDDVAYGPWLGEALNSAPVLDWEVVPTGRGDFDVHLRLCERSTQNGITPAGILELRLSDDPILNVAAEGYADPLVATLQIPGLTRTMPCASFSTTITPPPGATGPHTLFARRPDPNGLNVDQIETRAVGLGTGPDLAVRQARWETPDRALLRVCNDGTQATLSTTLAVYASTDGTFAGLGTLGGSDPIDAVVPVPALGPAECTTTRVTTARPLGTTLFFVPDHDRAVSELDEVGGVASLQVSSPTVDLVLEDLQVVDQRTSSIVLAPRVCNRGNGASPPSSVSVRLPNNWGGEPSLIGTLPIPALQPDACASPYGTITSASPATFLATVDLAGAIAETDEFNNAYDLSAISQTVAALEFDWLLYPTLFESPTGVALVQACNRGVQEEAVQGAFYSYEDATLYAFGGTGDYPYLHPDVCGVFSVQLNPVFFAPSWAPHLEFSWSAGAIDWATLDLAGRPIGRFIFGVGPDLAVRAATRIGDDLNIEVCNSGNRLAPPATASVRAGVDLDVEPRHSSPAQEVSRVPVPALAPGDCRVVLSPLPAASATTLAVVVVLDDPASRAEVITTNNGLRGPNLGLGPDLRVTSLSFVGAEASTIQPEVVVCNEGGSPSPSSTARLYFSLDRVADGAGRLHNGDQAVGEVSVGPLAPGACVTTSEVLVLPAMPSIDDARLILEVAPVWAWVAVDPDEQVEELDEGNNGSTLVRAPFGSGPDLTVRSASAQPLLSPNALEAELLVCNDGNQPSPPSEVRVDFALVEAHPSFGAPGEVGRRVSAGTAILPSLAPGSCSAQALGPTATALIDEGLYRLVAQVDRPDDVRELREDNNQLQGELVVLTAQGELTVRSATVGPDLDGFTRVTVEACNTGSADLYSPGASLILSVDQVVEPSEYFYGLGWPFLAPGGCEVFSSEPLEWTLPQWPLTELFWLGVHTAPFGDADPRNDLYWIGQIP